MCPKNNSFYDFASSKYNIKSYTLTFPDYILNIFFKKAIKKSLFLKAMEGEVMRKYLNSPGAWYICSCV